MFASFNIDSHATRTRMYVLGVLSVMHIITSTTCGPVWTWREAGSALLLTIHSMFFHLLQEQEWAQSVEREREEERG